MSLAKFKASFVLVACLLANIKAQSNGRQLKLINMVFRHGDRIPNPHEMVPNDPNKDHQWFPPGPGELTITGKKRAYTLGQALRKEYGSFVTPYDALIVLPQTTDIDRTKMTLLSLLAALYAPEETDPDQTVVEGLDWQPIPIFYHNNYATDRLLHPNACPGYNEARKKVVSDPKVQKQIAQFDGLVKEISNLTGKDMGNIGNLFGYYHLLEAEKSMGLTIPDYIKPYWPDGKLTEATKFMYKLLSWDDAMKRNNGGVLLEKMLADMITAAAGTIVPSSRKLFLYSAHEMNVAAMIEALGRNPEPPYYTSGVVLELSTNEQDEPEVRVRHYKGSEPEFEDWKIEGCDTYCPLKKFAELLKNVLPSKKELDSC